MRTRFLGTGSVFVLALFSALAFAEEIFVFPKAGQTDEQIEEDKMQCQSWAMKQSRFDPFSAPRESDADKRRAMQSVDEPLLNCQAYGAVKGAAGGAAGGYITGAVLGGKKKRATNFGAITGAMSGAAKRDQCERENASRRARNEQRRALIDNQNVQNGNGSREDFVRAYKTCLTAKDYSAS